MRIQKSFLIGFIFFFVPHFCWPADRCSDIFKSDHDVFSDPFLMTERQLVVIRSQNFNTFSSRKYQTLIGNLQLRQAKASEIAQLLELHGKRQEEEANFMSYILFSNFSPSIIDKSFLLWIVKGFRLQNSFGIEKTPEGLKIEILLRYFEMFEESAPKDIINLKEYIYIQKFKEIASTFDLDKPQRYFTFARLREQGLASPFNFTPRRSGNDGKPNLFFELIPDFEIRWLYRILMREHLVREALIQEGHLRTDTNFKEIVFFISAFPELFSLNKNIQDIGFEFNKYSLSDGFYTEGKSIPLLQIDSEIIHGRLVLEKRLNSTSEKSTAQITLRGKNVGSMSSTEFNKLERLIHIRWAEFLQITVQNQMPQLKINSINGLGYDLFVNLSGPQQPELTAKFLLFLATSPHSRLNEK